jgi:hypothetical protein
VYGHRTSKRLTLNLAKHSTVFQAEVYAIKACGTENINTGYKNQNIYNLPYSQAAIKALYKYHSIS